jgi:hypothetical protein
MKIKTQEIKKKVLKTLKLKNQKKSGKNEEEKEKPLFEDDPIDSDDNESLDSDQEVYKFELFLLKTCSQNNRMFVLQATIGICSQRTHSWIKYSTYKTQRI